MFSRTCITYGYKNMYGKNDTHYSQDGGYNGGRERLRWRVNSFYILFKRMNQRILILNYTCGGSIGVYRITLSNLL